MKNFDEKKSLEYISGKSLEIHSLKKSLGHAADPLPFKGRYVIMPLMAVTTPLHIWSCKLLVKT